MAPALGILAEETDGGDVSDSQPQRRAGVPGPQFILRSAKRVFDAKALYAQLVITDDCNLSCSYCHEYIPGAPPVRC